MRVPKLHIRGIGDIADVKRVKQQDTAPVSRDYVFGQARVAIFAHRLQIGQGLAPRPPIPSGRARLDLFQRGSRRWACYRAGSRPWTGQFCGYRRSFRSFVGFLLLGCLYGIRMVIFSRNDTMFATC